MRKLTNALPILLPVRRLHFSEQDFLLILVTIGCLKDFSLDEVVLTLDSNNVSSRSKLLNGSWHSIIIKLLPRFEIITIFGAG